MPRPTASLLVLLAVAATLAPVPALAARQGPCLAYGTDSAAAIVEEAAVILVGTVAESVPGVSVTVVPEFYLKGATIPRRLVIASDIRSPCETASLDAGERWLLILGERDGVVAWPGAEQAFALRDGVAYRSNGTVMAPETDLVSDIRAITGQYSVPPDSPGEGAAIDWLGTVLPVTAAVLVVFAIALVLMREWHRIDPT